MQTGRFQKAFRLAIITAVLAVSAGTAASKPTVKDKDAWKDLTPDAVERVKNGEIVIVTVQSELEEGGKALIKTAMIVDQGIDETYKMLRKPERQCEYLACQMAILIERNDQRDIVEFWVKVFGWILKFRTLYSWDETNYKINWTLDKNFDNSLVQQDGYWQLYSIDDNHTLIRYGSVVVLRKFIPMAIQEILVRRDLPKTMDATRKWLNSDGTYRKKE